MQEEETNFMFSLDSKQQDCLRYSTIRSVLSLDLESYLNNLGVLKSKLAGDFPLPFEEATYDQRLLMLKKNNNFNIDQIFTIIRSKFNHISKKKSPEAQT